MYQNKEDNPLLPSKDITDAFPNTLHCLFCCFLCHIRSTIRTSLNNRFLSLFLSLSNLIVYVFFNTRSIYL